MSVRSFRRARARRLEREQRRASTIARRGRVVGVTLGASMIFASAAQATTYTVTSNADDTSPAACTGTPATQCATLRDAVAAADSDSSADTIVFANGVSGAITLSSAGAMDLSNANGIAISGPGAGTLAIDAHTASQIFTISSTPAAPSSIDQINALTLENGSSSNPGGAIDVTAAMPLSLAGDTIKNSTSTNTSGGGGVFANSGPLTVTGSTISGNGASAGDGGGLEPSSGVTLTVSGTTISGNTALNGGGIGATHSGSSPKYTPAHALNVSGNSQITGNHATGTGANGNGGGIGGKFDTITITGSTISGNDATGEGGGLISKSRYGTTISGATVSGNRALSGGGVGVNTSGRKYAPGYAPVTIASSKLTGNQATNGSGVIVDRVAPGNTVSLQASTLSGNHGGASSFGGGIDVAGYVYGTFRLLDSTVSGNAASSGGGVSLGDASHEQLIGTNSNSSGGAVDLDNSTISGNSASASGGGVYLGRYTSGSTQHSGTAALRSTIVSGNGQDLARASTSTSGGFAGQFSLVQNPGSAPFTSKQEVITGVDPKLGPLASNGGPTQTMLPSGTSPVIDQGRAFDDLQTDQRGDPRTVDTPIPNPPGGDGTDIGAVELPASSVAGIGFKVFIDHAGALGSPHHRPLIAGRATPVLCSVRLGTISACVVKVKAGNKVVATGSASTTRSTRQLFLRVKPTAAGRELLKRHRFGIKATAFGIASAPGSPTVSGPVRLLGGPSITLRTGSGSKLAHDVLKELDRVAALLVGVKAADCTASAKHLAKEACNRLNSDGVKAKLHAAGGGKPGKLVISWRYRF